jgi:hypothetical protein
MSRKQGRRVGESNVPSIELDPEQFPEKEEEFPFLVHQILQVEEWQMYIPDGISDEMEAFQHVMRGKCMTCGTKLGTHTIVVVGAHGVLGLWCRGECLQDMHAVGFLTEVMDSITDAIEQREKGE